MIIFDTSFAEKEYYNLPYHIDSYIPTTLATSEILVMNVTPDNILFYTNFSGSYASAGVPSTNNVTLDIAINSTSIGYIDFISGDYQGSFISSNEYVSGPGSVITITAPSNPDPTLGNLTITLTGYTTDLSYNFSGLTYSIFNESGFTGVPLSDTYFINSGSGSTNATSGSTNTTSSSGSTGPGIGVFGGGTPNSSTSFSTTCIYNYSANTTVAGTNLTYTADWLAATGNLTEGVFGGGYNSAYLSTTCIYNYSANTTVAGTNLTYTADWLAATGNSTEGVFGGGYNGTTFFSTTSIYNYSANTTIAGINLTYAANGLAATGNSIEGVFGGGYNSSTLSSTTSIYNYSANTTIAGTNLTHGVWGLAATGNSTEGVFGGGSNSGAFYDTTCIYNYSANTTVAGTNLTYTVWWSAACSPQANGLSS